MYVVITGWHIDTYVYKTLEINRSPVKRRNISKYKPHTIIIYDLTSLAHCTFVMRYEGIYLSSTRFFYDWGYYI